MIPFSEDKDDTCSSWTILCVLLLSLSFFPMSVFKYILPLTFIILVLYQEHFPMGLSIPYFIDYNIAHFVISEIGVYFQ